MTRVLIWIALATVGVGVAAGLTALNGMNPGDPLFGFRTVYIWVLAAVWVFLMISAIFLERGRR